MNKVTEDKITEVLNFMICEEAKKPFDPLEQHPPVFFLKPPRILTESSETIKKLLNKYDEIHGLPKIPTFKEFCDEQMNLKLSRVGR